MNKESLGEKLVDGYRVIVGIPVTGYYVAPLRPDGTGVKLFYANRSESSGAPFYLYKRFGSYAVAKIFDKILSRVQTYQNLN